MKSKSLLALMLCGALCLTACVKDVESDSVSKVRDAKAQELASITALNNANAAAATLLANAEAALMNAEAAAKEAEAAKIAAETEILKVQAQLAAVEVEIAQVKLEQEKVELEKKKAELEALLVELEADKAEAELRKEKAAAEMERLALEVEAEMLRAQTALLKAQKEYNQIANDLNNDGLITLADAYYSASYKLYEAQAELARLKIELARLENELVDMNEAKAKTIINNKNEIARLEIIVANLETKQGQSLEELRAAELVAFENLLNASDALAPANEAYNAAEQNLYAAYNAVFSSAYTDGLLDMSGLSNVNHYEVYDIDENGNYILKYCFTNAEGEEVVLFNEAYYGSELVTYPEAAEAPVHGHYYKAAIVPATANPAAYTELVAVEKAAVQANYDSQVEYLTQWLESDTYNRDYYAAQYDVLAPMVEEREAAYEAAVEAKDEAYKARTEARRARDLYGVQNFFADQVELQESIQDAYDSYDEAFNHYYNLVWSYIDSYGYWPDSWEVEHVNSYISSAEMNVAYATGDLKQYQTAEYTKSVADAEKALADADAAVAKQEEAVTAKEDAVKTAQETERAAELIYAADRTEANLSAWQKAQEATAKAYDALYAEYDKLTPLQNAAYDAQTAYDNLVSPLLYAEQRLADCEAELAGYKTRLEEVQTILAAEEDFNAKYDAYQALTDELALLGSDDEEYQALCQAYIDADDAWRTAWDAMNEAANELESFSNDHNYLNIKASYENWSSWVAIDEANLADAKETYDNNMAALAEVEARFTAALAAEADYAAAIANVESLDQVCFEAYCAYVDAQIVFVEADAEYTAITTAISEESNLANTIELYKDEIERLQAEIDYVLDIESQEAMVQYTKGLITALETKIKVLEQKVAEAKDALDAATAAVTE